MDKNRENAVLVKNAYKAYGQKQVLINLSMKVKRGTMYVNFHCFC